MHLPLAENGAQYSHDGGKSWKTVLPHWRIAHCTLAQLGPAWWPSHILWRINGEIYTTQPNRKHL